ncbi:restriction endonuclease subunit S [Corynebacterium variabile]|uniref:restriction endonuclease subunit S n=1 Tax=Corynebacterium variabile TaxID=1727 RepID=UPI002FDF4C44
MSNYDEYPVPAIAELLEELCPEGVKVVPTTNTVDFIRGLTYSKAEEDLLGDVTVLRANNISLQTSRLDFTDLKRITRKNKPIRPDLFLRANDILMAANSGSKQHVGKTTFITDDMPNVVFGGFMAVLRSKPGVNARYIYHLLSSRAFLEYKNQVLQSSTINNIKQSTLEGFEIPLPPPEVQEQIVTILDTFTDLEASLNRELELRADQFAHALDSVFGNSTAPRSTLGQVGDFTKGKGVTKAQLQDEGIPAFHYGQVHTSYGHSATSTISYIDPKLIKNPTFAHPSDLVLATTSEDDEAVGKAVAWLGDEDAVVGGDAYVYSHSLEPRYVSYFFASHDFQLQKGLKVYGTKVRRINDKGLSALTIPVPAPEVQEQIADTLDLFTGYTFNLRREIDLRRQQLEYYREQLLTFPVDE